ncbi:MAG: AmmeMemoRadiSam system radical SAM enzyme [Spirochaetes bacterium]|nr:AmmeMemoRadiSam system radical SAM enzyme [Spirochaetota bacterium]
MSKLSRKEFLKAFCYSAQTLVVGTVFPFLPEGIYASNYRIAMHWKKIDSSTIQCNLCPNGCTLSNDERGVCKARHNIDGRLHSIVYGQIAAYHIDPIEKKPLYHFLPGSDAVSVATAGCNFSCKFCQNWQLSQSQPEELYSRHITPSQLATQAITNKSRIIAFTYNEPSIQYEYVYDTVQIAKKYNIACVIISNGYLNKNASEQLYPLLNAIKIDFKAYSQKFYQDICGGNLSPVLANIELAKKKNVWLELVNLVIPTLNDDPDEIKAMARFIKTHCGITTPLHFTRFYPIYKLKNIPPTPVSTLERCRQIALAEGLKYVYIGNVPGHAANNTYCHNCGKPVIERSGFYTTTNKLKSGRCPHCQTEIPGIWTI